MSIFCLSVFNYSECASIFSSRFNVRYIIQTFIFQQLFVFFSSCITENYLKYAHMQLALKFSHGCHLSYIYSHLYFNVIKQFLLVFFSAEVGTFWKQWNYISDHSTAL